jgi:hypothetical protein
VLEAERLDELVVALDPEIEVFEEAERGQIQQDRDQDGVTLRAGTRTAVRQRFYRLVQHRPKLPGIVCDDEAHEPIHERREEHERHEARLRPAVKGVAGQDQPEISPALRRPAQRIIAQERERQKIVNEDVRAKNHGPPLLRYPLAANKNSKRS